MDGYKYGWRKLKTVKWLRGYTNQPPLTNLNSSRLTWQWLTICYLVVYLVSSISIPRKVYLFTFCIIRSPKCFDTTTTIASFTLYSMCENLLYATYQNSVHCSLFTILFDTHMPYRFNSKYTRFNVLFYNSYKIMAYSMHPYSISSKHMYRTFLPFSYLIYYFKFRVGITYYAWNITL